jgi:hypothetical protein
MIYKIYFFTCFVISIISGFVVGKFFINLYETRQQSYDICKEVNHIIDENLTMIRSAEVSGDSTTVKKLRENNKIFKTGLKNMDCKE